MGLPLPSLVNHVPLSNRLSICLCQVDTHVLQSLPDDIRNSIEEALQAKRCDREIVDGETSDGMEKTERCRAVDVCCVDDGERAGCSHWTSDDAHVLQSASLKCPTSLLSYSQVT